uniref:Tyrosine recombinase n=1 Tax=Clostridioides difficile TaxID=1496 RepID=A0A381I957_CLODI|nr:tyrosine recombinase [Clostridioides difficile]
MASYFMDIKKYMEYINQKSIKLVDIVENDIISYLIKLEKIMYQ